MSEMWGWLMLGSLYGGSASNGERQYAGKLTVSEFLSFSLLLAPLIVSFLFQVSFWSVLFVCVILQVLLVLVEMKVKKSQHTFFGITFFQLFYLPVVLVFKTNVSFLAGVFLYFLVVGVTVYISVRLNDKYGIRY
ncbi:hypothetical protein [Pilibacter termitis]|nr:hypothetical protein [Pilibacter termitis]